MTAKNGKSPRKAISPLTITRIFDAPRSLVFAAWTQPDHLKEWSAPRGFTVPVSKGQVRPGGRWHATMRAPDGEDLKLSGVYQEIVPDKRLVFTHAWEENGKRGHETVVTVTFSDLNEKTKMVFRQASFESAASRNGHKGGWNECFDRLAALLKSLVASKPSKTKSHVPAKSRG